MDVKIHESWKNAINQEFKKNYFVNLVDFVRNEYQEHKIYPPGKEIFRAFDKCHFENVKVVLVGQDPYHGEGQANGLCFSVRDGIKHPPSLRNIFKERKDDIGKEIPTSGDLTHWAEQGVLMLNATLTVRAKSAGSHQKKGWEEFTDAVIHALNDKKDNLVFILWGAYAQKKGAFIDSNKHFIIKTAHPSPFSAHNGFFGSKPFSQVNEYLKSIGEMEIEW